MLRSGTFKLRHFTQTPRIFEARRCYSDSSFLSTISGIYTSMSESAPVIGTQQLLETIHQSTHLPWWATIVVGSISLRFLFTLPLSAYQHYIFGKVENLQPEMSALMKELKKETAIAIKKFNWTEKEAKRAYLRSAKTQWNKLIIRENCHPFKAHLILWVQIPLWMCMSIALRNMTMMLPSQTPEAQLLHFSMSLEGFGWIPNLTDIDHSFIFPVAMVLTNLAIIEFHSLVRVTPTSRLSKGIVYTLRGLCIVMIPIAINAPAGLSLFWTTSSVCALLQNMILLSPKVRRAFRIPKTPRELENPYRHIREQIKARFNKNKTNP